MYPRGKSSPKSAGKAPGKAPEEPSHASDRHVGGSIQPRSDTPFTGGIPFYQGIYLIRYTKYRIRYVIIIRSEI